MMTRKHFKAVAAAIATERQHAQTTDALVAIDNVTAALAQVFAAENPRFDGVKFWEATRS